MKKLLLLFLIAIMLLSLVACSAEAPAAPTAAQSGTDALTQTEAVQDSTQAEKIVSFEEITVVDNEFCTIKITAVEPDDFWGYAVKAYLENKSSDKTFMYSVTSASINDVMADPMFAAEVAPGKKSNETISFLTADLDTYDIGDFTDIALNFRVYDSADWMAEPVAVSSAHVYPYGEENAVSFVHESQSDDTVLIDDNNPESTFLDKENITDLTDKIKLSLSSFEYKVLTAYLKYGSYSETATALCVSSKDVNNALHRARKKIKKSIGSYR